MFDSLRSHVQLESLYVAPAALGDYCDSSGCLPGQIPLPGMKAKAVINRSAELTMNQVRPEAIIQLTLSFLKFGLQL
jgi:hypothetical protein